VPEATLLAIWCREKGFSERNARKLLTTLGRKALLTLQGESSHRRVSFHDLQHDYLQAVAGDGRTGPDDGYFFQKLPWHLKQAGERGSTASACIRFEWPTGSWD
jgi:hypothetical protein